MANVQIYFGIENLNLTNAQKLTLLNGLRVLGDNSSLFPNFRNHERIRSSDNDAIIFEASFDEDTLKPNAIRQRVATIFTVNVAQVTANVSNSPYGDVATFVYNSQNRFRMVAFGATVNAGANTITWPGWSVSNAAARAYLAANAAAWGNV